MNQKPEKHSYARDLFFGTDKSRKEIAEMLGLDPKTLYLWIKNGHWEEMKAAAAQAPGIVTQQLYNHITAINSKISQREDCAPTFQEVEMLRKLISSTKQIQQMSVSTYIQTFQELTGFIYSYTKDHEITKQVTLLADKYISGKLKDQKFYCDAKIKEVCKNVREMDAIEQQDEIDATLAAQQENKGRDALNASDPQQENKGRDTSNASGPQQENKGGDALNASPGSPPASPPSGTDRAQSGISTSAPNATEPNAVSDFPGKDDRQNPDSGFLDDREFHTQPPDK